jgi:hypothetical protein
MTVIIDYSIGLYGALPPRAGFDRRGLAMEEAAALTIAPDGRVIGCRVRPASIHGAPELLIGAGPLCRFQALRGHLFPPAGGAPRRGLIRREIYVRSGPGRPG